MSCRGTDRACHRNGRSSVMGPDPSWTVPAVTAIGQLLVGIDELVNEVFQLDLDKRLADAAAAFQVSLS
jgi:hypothetical protein